MPGAPKNLIKTHNLRRKDAAPSSTGSKIQERRSLTSRDTPSTRGDSTTDLSSQVVKRFMDMTYNMVAGSEHVKPEIKRFMKHDVELNRWQNVRRHQGNHPTATRFISYKTISIRRLRKLLPSQLGAGVPPPKGGRGGPRPNHPKLTTFF